LISKLANGPAVSFLLEIRQRLQGSTRSLFFAHTREKRAHFGDFRVVSRKNFCSPFAGTGCNLARYLALGCMITRRAALNAPLFVSLWFVRFALDLNTFQEWRISGSNR
jgi:hypothetical protein